MLEYPAYKKSVKKDYKEITMFKTYGVEEISVYGFDEGLLIHPKGYFSKDDLSKFKTFYIFSGTGYMVNLISHDLHETETLFFNSMLEMEREISKKKYTKWIASKEELFYARLVKQNPGPLPIELSFISEPEMSR